MVTRGVPAERVAESTNGQIDVRLARGLYTVAALLRDEPGRPARFCEAAAIDVVRREPRVEHMTLRCSIK